MTERDPSRFKWLRTCPVILVLTCALAMPSVAVAADRLPAKYELADLEALQAAFVDLADEVRPSVVAIRTYQTINPARRGTRPITKPLSRGSGFVIDAGGFIATNRHVVEGADVISVMLSNHSQYDAEIVQVDVRHDLAVIRIEEQDLKPVVWGDVTDLRVNQWAFVVGNPFGLANRDGVPSVTAGVISAMQRQMTDELVPGAVLEYYGNLIETTAAINPGNSGGPLFNIKGEIIGVVTAIATSTGANEGTGFAIPIDANTRTVIDTLKVGQVVRYGFLGIDVQTPMVPRSRAIARTRPLGALITRIQTPDGPAAQAGLKSKDIIIKFNDVSVENSDHLVRLVSFTPVGTEASVLFLRDGIKRRVEVTLADRVETLGLAARE